MGPTHWREWPEPIRRADLDALCREFDAVLVAWGCPNFSARELWRVNDRRGSEPELQIPRRELWPHMRETVQIAQRARDRWGGPIRVQCGYRSPLYNVRCGGAKASLHMQYNALDVRPPTYGPGRDWAAWCDLVTAEVEALHAGGVTVGLGRYHDPDLRFVHIDVGLRAHNWTEDIR